MHKHIVSRVVSLVAVCLTVIALAGLSKAEVPQPWITSPLSINKQADAPSLPTSLNGNIDCYKDDLYSCPVPTTYGMANQQGVARLNGTDGYKPVISYVDGQQHFLPIPNSNTVISYSGGPVYGLYYYFTSNFTSSITRAKYIDGVELEYRINRAPDGKLADKSNHYLPADYESVSFSTNGNWMVVSDPNIAMLRVNLSNFEVLPFAPGFNYTLGVAPAIKSAVSNDGRYAVVASKNFNSFTIYDLSTCGPVPDTIRGGVACQSRDLNRFMQERVPGYISANSIRFLNDNNIAIYATYKSGGINKSARFIIGNGSPISSIEYLALGDSYISGEGAFDYQGGTDNDDNRCHVSNLAYPYLMGRRLDYNSYHSVACSGAVTDDITNSSDIYKGQADDRTISRNRRSQDFIGTVFSSFTPGYINQLEFVSSYQPQAITISIGGNDMGFSKVLLNCVETGTCYSTYEDRLELIHQINSQVYPKLVSTYQQLKHAGSPDMRIYVIGYPQIADPEGNCALNVHFNHDELILSQQLISYLDSVIQKASAKAGVFYVDTQAALAGHRLCEAGPGEVAMNGLTAGNDKPGRIGGPIGDESYHPNALGHQLLEEAILAATGNLSAPMPEPDSTIANPTDTGLDILGVAHSGRSINSSQYDAAIADDLAYKQSSFDVAIAGSDHALRPSSPFQAALHSDLVSLGTFSTDSSGNLSAQIYIPSSVSPGVHTLHFYGTDILGSAIDIYKTIYVGASPTDIDGDGVSDLVDKCIGVTASEQDYDGDGIDDACDGTIGLAPVNLTSFKQLPGNTLGVMTADVLTTPAQTASVSSEYVSIPQKVLSDNYIYPRKTFPTATANNPSHRINTLVFLLTLAFALPAVITVYALRRH